MPCNDYRTTITETSGPTELGVGDVADGEFLKRVGDEIVGATVSASGVPVGFIGEWPTTSAPSGWLLCDGTAVSRTTYLALYTRIGTTFGIGDGATTFNLPDYRDRFAKGLISPESIGDTGGSETPTVSITDPGHTHTVAANVQRQAAAVGNNTASTQSTGSSTTGITASIADGRPPYLVINKIIKT